MSFNKSQRSAFLGIIAVLFVCVALLQNFIDPLRRQPAIEPKNASKAGTAVVNGAAALPFEYSLGAVTGFRQVIAGLLWVRSDAFFHEGNYDAILPLIRLITWLDPNWLDPYSTGAWHLMYNFTDTDQRSDRRYLPAGLALLKEGIANNPDIYDMYKEAGWNNFDKIKNYAEAGKYYEQAEAHDPNYDVTTVGHSLAHCYERQGLIPQAIAEWQKCVDKHKQLMDDPKSSQDVKLRNTQGYKNSVKNLALLRRREAVRPKDITPPVDAGFTVKIERISPRVLQISGTFNLIGSKNWDVDKGVLISGPVSGARVDIRLQDAGYKMPNPDEFTFEIDDSLTIMQDSLSIRGGRETFKGGLYIADKNEVSADPDQNSQNVDIFVFGPVSGKGLGTPLKDALASGVQLSPLGQLQLVSVAYPLNGNGPKKQYTPQEVAELLAKVKADAPKIAELTARGYSVANKDVHEPGTFKRKIDMSRDPKMYSFTAGKYDLIASVNPQGAPDFVKDRIGWLGEGLTDKNYLDTKTLPGVHLIRKQMELTRDDMIASGDKVLVAK